MPVRSSHPLACETSVNRWWDELTRRSGLDDAELCRRADILQQFSAFIGRSPDQMVEDVFDLASRRIPLGRRSAYAESILAFQSSLKASVQTRVHAGNVVRSFFIHNGVFLHTPLAPWVQ